MDNSFNQSIFNGACGIILSSELSTPSFSILYNEKNFIKIFKEHHSENNIYNISEITLNLY
jgi:hypothetical protein